MITGDLMHNPCQIGHPNRAIHLRQRSRLCGGDTWGFLERFADTPTIVIGTHFGTPTGVRVCRDRNSFHLAPLQ